MAPRVTGKLVELEPTLADVLPHLDTGPVGPPEPDDVAPIETRSVGSLADVLPYVGRDAERRAAEAEEQRQALEAQVMRQAVDDTLPRFFTNDLSYGTATFPMDGKRYEFPADVDDMSKYEIETPVLAKKARMYSESLGIPYDQAYSELANWRWSTHAWLRGRAGAEEIRKREDLVDSAGLLRSQYERARLAADQMKIQYELSRLAQRKLWGETLSSEDEDNYRRLKLVSSGFRDRPVDSPFSGEFVSSIVPGAAGFAVQMADTAYHGADRIATGVLAGMASSWAFSSAAAASGVAAPAAPLITGASAGFGAMSGMANAMADNSIMLQQGLLYSELDDIPGLREKDKRDIASVAGAIQGMADAAGDGLTALAGGWAAKGLKKYAEKLSSEAGKAGFKAAVIEAAKALAATTASSRLASATGAAGVAALGGAATEYATGFFQEAVQQTAQGMAAELARRSPEYASMANALLIGMSEMSLRGLNRAGMAEAAAGLGIGVVSGGFHGALGFKRPDVGDLESEGPDLAPEPFEGPPAPAALPGTLEELAQAGTESSQALPAPEPFEGPPAPAALPGTLEELARAGTEPSQALPAPEPFEGPPAPAALPVAEALDAAQAGPEPSQALPAKEPLEGPPAPEVPDTADTVVEIHDTDDTIWENPPMGLDDTIGRPDMLSEIRQAANIRLAEAWSAAKKLISVVNGLKDSKNEAVAEAVAEMVSESDPDGYEVPVEAFSAFFEKLGIEPQSAANDLNVKGWKRAVETGGNVLIAAGDMLRIAQAGDLGLLVSAMFAKPVSSSMSLADAIEFARRNDLSDLGVPGKKSGIKQFIDKVFADSEFDLSANEARRAMSLERQRKKPSIMNEIQARMNAKTPSPLDAPEDAAGDEVGVIEADTRAGDTEADAVGISQPDEEGGPVGGLLGLALEVLRESFDLDAGRPPVPDLPALPGTLEELAQADLADRPARVESPAVPSPEVEIEPASLREEGDTGPPTPTPGKPRPVPDEPVTGPPGPVVLYHQASQIQYIASVIYESMLQAGMDSVYKTKSALAVVSDYATALAYGVSHFVKDAGGGDSVANIVASLPKFAVAQKARLPNGTYAPFASYNASTNTISVSPGATLDALGEEIGHLYLELMRSVAAANPNSQSAKDLAAITKEHGVDYGTALANKKDPDWFALHERWAGGHIKFLAEEKAGGPLAGAFRRFSRWLIQVAMRLPKLSAPIESAYRNIYSAIQVTANNQHLLANGRLGDVRGIMSDKDAAAWARADDKAEQIVAEEAVAASEKVQKSLFSRARKSVEDSMRKEVHEAVENSRPFTALQLLTDVARMDMAKLVKIYGKARVKALPRWKRKAVYAKNGIDPQRAAALLGYESLDEMMSELSQLKSLDEEKAAALKRASDAHFDELARDNGFKDVDAVIEYEALLNTATRTKDIEYAQLLEMMKSAPAQSRKLLKALAADGRVKDYSDDVRNELLQTPIGETKKPTLVKRYMAVSSKRRLESVDSWSRGNHTDAVVKKAQGVHALAYADETGKAQREIRKLEKRWKRVTGDALRSELMSYDTDLPSRIEAIVQQHGGPVTDATTLQQLNAMMAAIEAEIDLAKSKGSWLDAARADTAADIRKRARISGKKKPGKDAGVEGKNYERKDRLLWILGTERLSLRLSGEDRSGLAYKEFYDWRIAAAGEHMDRHRVYQKMFLDFMNNELRAARELKGRGLKFEGLAEFGHAAAVMMGTKIGNSIDMAKLVNYLGVTREEIIEKLDGYLTPADWDFVEATWIEFDSRNDEADAVSEAHEGKRLPKIQPEPITLPSGRVLRGGYSPAYHLDEDGNTNDSAQKRLADDLAAAVTKGGLGVVLAGSDFSTTTGHPSWTRNKAESNQGSLDLDIMGLMRHHHSVSWYIAHRAGVMRMARILSGKDVRKAIVSTQGRRVYNALIRDLARTAVGASAQTTKTGRRFKTAASAMYLAVRLKAGIPQVVGGFIDGMSQIARDHGTARMMRAMVSVLLHPFQSFRFANSQSPNMKHRTSAVEQDISRQVGSMPFGTETRGYTRMALGQAQHGAERLVHAGLWPIFFADKLASHATWMTKYALELEDGKSFDEATSSADQTVANTQGSSAQKDMSEFRMTPDWSVFLGMFYTYGQNLVNRMDRMYGDWVSDDATAATKMRLAMEAITVFVVAPILTDLITGAVSDDDMMDEDGEISAGRVAKYTALRTTTTVAQGFPWARDAASALYFQMMRSSHGSANVEPPVARIAGTLVSALSELTSDEEGDKHSRRLYFESVAFLSGLAGMPLPGRAAYDLYEEAMKMFEDEDAAEGPFTFFNGAFFSNRKGLPARAAEAADRAIFE